MISIPFLIAAIVYVVFSVFVFFSYPKSWRKNKLFVAVLIIWHVLGLTCLVTVFTFFRYIPYENLRYEITRIASCYYITTTIMALLFAIRYVYRRTNLYISDRLGRKISERRMKIYNDKRIHALIFIALSFAIFFAGYFNIDFLHDTRYDVTVYADSAQDKLDICLISDIHVGSGTWEYTYDDMVEMIDQSDADVLLIAGDVFDETTGEKDIQNFA